MTRYVARQLALRPFPHGTLTPGVLGDHIMGMAVLGWLTQYPVARWGEDWMRAGRLQATFERPMSSGQVLDIVTDDSASNLVTTYTDDAGRTCVTGIATLIDEVDTDLADTALRRPPPSPTPRRPVASELLGAVLPQLLFTFRARHDLAFLDGQADAAMWVERGWAHPAWLGTASNAAVMGGIDFDQRGENTGRWLQVSADVSLVEPIVDGDEVLLTSRIERISTRGLRGRHQVAHLACTFRVGERTVARLLNSFVFASAPVDHEHDD